MEQPALQNSGLEAPGATTDELIVEARGLIKTYGKGLAATRVAAPTS